ncbi:hypothetical protein PHMEG_00020844 [Phytophthora megakarya]|uniref:Uncharacterized protein n=1 Tax=Phytophthora megakarya TaxID=4795 RepID=A0A225VPA5_9STRA|nr:hypothetical protein PHMEG_00020844 [Phytophthora megakarya]
MEVSYICGRTRDPRADSEGNIAFRNSYLQIKVSNLNARKYPKIREFFLDERFCNVNQVAGSTWLPKHSARYSSSGCYHGNFNGTLFLKWFEGVCAVLELVYAPCRIHMDGAAYSKVQINAPSSAALKAELKNWLREQGCYVPGDYTRKQLRAVIAQVSYFTFQILFF